MATVKEGLAAMRTENKRPRVHDAQMVTKLPKPVKALVEQYAKDHAMAAADVVRDALAEYFTRRGYDR